MSSRSLKKPRIIRSYRAIIPTISLAGRPEFLLFQRATNVHYPGFWECLGATPEDGNKVKASWILPKGGLSEGGIRITRIFEEIYRHQRPIEEWPGSRYNDYDIYESLYFLVDCATIKRIDLCPQHRGFGWFPLPAIICLKKIVRESTWEAFKRLTSIDLSKYQPQINHRHH